MKKLKRNAWLLLFAMCTLSCLFFTEKTTVHAETQTSGDTEHTVENESINSFLNKIGEANYLYIRQTNTIILQNDVEIVGKVFLEDFSDTLTLDLNGKTMTLLTETPGEGYDFGGITVNYDAALTIKNSGRITTSYAFVPIWVYGGTLQILKSETPAPADNDKEAGVPVIDTTYVRPEGTLAYPDVLQVSNKKNDDGTVISANVYIEDACFSAADGGGISFYGGALQIDHATVTATKNAIHNNSCLSRDTLLIKDGDYTSTEGNAVAIIPSTTDDQTEPVYGYTYLQGGNYYGKNDGLNINCGKLFVSGPIHVEAANYSGIAMWDSTLVISDNRPEILGNSNGIYADTCDIYIAGGNFTGNNNGIWSRNSTLEIQDGAFNATKYSGLYADKACSIHIFDGQFQGQFGLDTWKADAATAPQITINGGTFTGVTCGIRMHESKLYMTDALVKGEQAEGAYLEDTDMYLKGGSFEGSYGLKFAAFLDEEEAPYVKAYMLLGEDGENHIQFLQNSNDYNADFFIVNPNNFRIFQISNALDELTPWVYAGTAFEMLEPEQCEGKYKITDSTDENLVLHYPDPNAAKYQITYMHTEGTLGNEKNPKEAEEGQIYPLYDLYKENAYFIGWYTDPDFTNQVTELSGLTSDITLYAKFDQEDRAQKQIMNISHDKEISVTCVDTAPFVPRITIISGNTEATITYDSSNPDIAATTSDGKVQITGKAGTTLLSGHIPGNDQFFSKDFDIFLRVEKQVATITYVIPSSISPGMKNLTLQAQVTNTNGATPGKLDYFSSDTSVLTVYEDGTLEPHRCGTSTMLIQMQETDNCRADSVRFDIYVSPAADINPGDDSLVTHILTLDSNGGNLSASATLSVTENCAYGILPVPERTGYSFSGWYTQKEDGTKITSDTLVTRTEDHTLYAHWSLNEYSILYVLNEGKNNALNPAVYSIASDTILLKNPTRKGYSFSGWYSDKNFKNQVKKIEPTSTGNITLYAKWKVKTYKISYTLKGGKNHKKNIKTYTVRTKTFKLKSPSRKGYQFKGWYTDKKYKHKIKKIKKGSTGNIKLYAKWKKL